MASLPLLPMMVKTVAPLPVLCAGGVADGRGLAAVLALGAEGVLLGTRFMATAEARPMRTSSKQSSKATATTRFSRKFRTSPVSASGPAPCRAPSAIGLSNVGPAANGRSVKTPRRSANKPLPPAQSAMSKTPQYRLAKTLA